MSTTSDRSKRNRRNPSPPQQVARSSVFGTSAHSRTLRWRGGRVLLRFVGDVPVHNCCIHCVANHDGTLILLAGLRTSSSSSSSSVGCLGHRKPYIQQYRRLLSQARIVWSQHSWRGEACGGGQSIVPKGLPKDSTLFSIRMHILLYFAYSTNNKKNCSSAVYCCRLKAVD